MTLTRRDLTLAVGAAMCAPLSGRAQALSRPQLALRDAVHFAFPIFEFARTAWAAAMPSAQRPQHRFNTIAHRSTLADHTYRVVTTPNNDTLYSSARIDLTNGPVLIEAPSLNDRYFSVAFMNAYTDNFAYIGTRATNGAGGRFAIVGPQWRGAIPSDARAFRSETNDVWMLARILVTGPEDLPRAAAAQQQLRILASGAPNLPTVEPVLPAAPENLLAVANSVLARSPSRDPVGRLWRRFERDGIGKGRADAWQGLSKSQRQAWTETLAETLERLRDGFAARGEIVQGWRYPPPGIGGAHASLELRAAVSLSGLGALEAIEATYMRANVDSAGTLLDGSARYVLTLPREIPVTGFWSLSLYRVEPDGRLFFAQNEIGRYSLGDRTSGLVRGADGSVRILIQHTAPEDRSANWLPSPSDRFALVFRGYIPSAEMLSGKWRLPPITRSA